VVVDKVNGGKADALNSGVNLTRYPYICTVDGDTVYTRDALLKGMRLVLRDPNTIIGASSVVGITRRPECMATEGLAQYRLDRDPLSNYQHLDYLRSFINGRLGWSRLNFMMCAVGAFAIWRRDVVVEVGGFSRDFTCEDIEFTFRVYEKFLREKRPIKVLALSDTVAFTEGPEHIKQLVSQRARWQRVIMETVWHYRKMLLNPRYRSVGMIGMPYYTVSEFLAPLFQTLSVVSLLTAVWLRVLDWPTFLVFVGVVAFANALYTGAALLLQDSGHRLYRLSDLVYLMLIAPLELFLYRPILFYAQLKGAFGFVRGDKQWHKFERNQRPAAAPATPVAQ
jgi:cellulose synthase/poly-beta-1,6-N-acetylglucosamine synthase-like glycosyltransferase